MREIILGHVEFALIFLFNGFLCKIAILEPLKVRFLDKKQKLLSDNGTSVVGSGVDFGMLNKFQEYAKSRMKNVLNSLFLA